MLWRLACVFADLVRSVCFLVDSAFFLGVLLMEGFVVWVGDGGSILGIPNL